MLVTRLLLVGFMTVLGVTAGPCLPEEYETIGGQCCYKCPQGNRVKRDCTHLTPTSCQPCTEGTFMNVANGQNLCFSCTQCNKGSGLRTQTSCTTVSDTVCEAQEGYFCIDSLEESCMKAQKHMQCQAGYHIKEKGNSRSDTVCEECPEGSFSEDGVACKAWTVCPGTKRKLEEGSRKSDVVCGSATRHHYFLFIVALSLLTQFEVFTD